MNTNRYEYRWTSFATTTSRDEAHPGARASRPHNTGKAPPISSTRLDRQLRQDPASAEPMSFPPAGWPGAPSQGNRAARSGSACGRDARAPGGASSHHSWCSRKHAPARRPAAVPMRQGRRGIGENSRGFHQWSERIYIRVHLWFVLGNGSIIFLECSPRQDGGPVEQVLRVGPWPK